MSGKNSFWGGPESLPPDQIAEAQALANEPRNAPDVPASGSALVALSRRSIVGLSLAAFVPRIAFAADAGVLPSKTPPPKPAPRPSESSAALQESPFLSEEETVKLYDEGFNLLMKNLPDDPKDEKLKALRDLKSFREGRVRWATSSPEGSSAIEIPPPYTARNAAFIVVIPKGHPDIKNRPTLSAYPTDQGIMVLHIKPVPITPEWAGIFQLHELIHLYDPLMGIEPRNPNEEQYFAGENRAYSIEVAGADHMTNGKFSQKITELIQKYRFKDYHDLLPFFDRDRLTSLVFDLRRLPGSSVTSALPKSQNEDKLRVAFCLVAVGQRLIENQKKPQAEKQADFRSFMQAIKNAKIAE